MPVDLRTGLQRPDATPARPDTPAIPRPTGPSNPYDDQAQRIVREADANAGRRDSTPTRERGLGNKPVDPDVSTDAGRFGFGRGSNAR